MAHLASSNAPTKNPDQGHCLYFWNNRANKSHLSIPHKQEKKKMYGFYRYRPLRKENGSLKTLETPEAESQLKIIMEVFLLEQWLTSPGSLDRWQWRALCKQSTDRKHEPPALRRLHPNTLIPSLCLASPAYSLQNI